MAYKTVIDVIKNTSSALALRGWRPGQAAANALPPARQMDFICGHQALTTGVTNGVAAGQGGVIPPGNWLRAG